MPRIPRLDEPLRDDAVVVRLAAERDIPEVLIAHQEDPKLYARLGLRRPPSGAELGRRMEEAEDDLAAGARVTLTILERGSDDCRGQVEVHEIDWDAGRASLNLWAAPPALERPARELVARWLRGECGLAMRDG